MAAVGPRGNALPKGRANVRKAQRGTRPAGGGGAVRETESADLTRAIADATPPPRTSIIWTEYQRAAAMATAARRVLKTEEKLRKAGKALTPAALWKNVGKFDPHSVCFANDLATARELVTNLENEAERLGWTTEDRFLALTETLRGDAKEWWNSQEAGEARRGGWDATRTAVLARFEPSPGYKGDDVEQIQAIPKPPGWGRVSTVIGNCELNYVPGAATAEDSCPVAGDRPWLKVRPHSLAKDPEADIDFLVDSGTPWSTITTEVLQALKAANAVHGSMVHWQPGRKRHLDLFVLHVCVANAGVLALRAVIADDRPCSVGHEDMKLFGVTYHNSGDGGMISIGFLRKRFYAAFEPARRATGGQDLQ